MDEKRRIRIPLPDGRLLSLKIVSIGFGDALPVPPPDPITFEVVDIRLRTKKPRPAPAGCPRCAHALSLMPDLGGRIN